MLEKNILQLNLGQGVDQKTDRHVSEKPLVVENALFQKPGALEKTYGTRRINDDTISARTCFTYGDELLVASQEKLYTFNSESEAFQEKGVLPILKSKTDIVLASDAVPTNPTIEKIGNTYCYAYKDQSINKVVVIVQDAVTNSIVASHQYTGDYPKLFVAGSNYCAVWRDAGNIKSAIIAPSGVEAYTATVTADAKDGVFDVCAYGSRGLLLWNSTAGGGSQKIGVITQTGALAGTLDGAPAPAEVWNLDANAACAVQIYGSGTSQVIFVFGRRTPDFTQVAKLDGAFNVLATENPALGGTMTESVAIVVTSDIVEIILSNAISTLATPDQDRYVQSSVYDHSLTQLGASNKRYRHRLATKPFTVGETTYYIATSGYGAFQSHHVFSCPNERKTTLFYQYDVVTRLNGGVAGVNASTTTISNVVYDGSKYIFAALLVPTVDAENGKVSAKNALIRSSITPDGEIDHCITNGIALITSGSVFRYDGKSLSELGFYHVPKLYFNSYTTGGAGTAGSRSYVAVYEWTDAKGNIEQSLVSDPVTANPTDAQKVVFDVEPLTATMRSDVRIVLYRTAVGGSTYYRVTPHASIVTNNRDVANQQITDDNFTDAVLVGNETLYTTGNVLDNTAPPAAQTICAYNGRAVLAGTEDDAAVWYSKQFNQFEMPAFNEALQFRCEDDEGGVTCVRQMDEKLIVFKRNAIFFNSFEGPNNIGQQSDVRRAVIVSRDVGCISPRSIVLGPTGLIFKSQKGFFLLSRTLDLQYIGASVEGLNSLTPSGAFMIDSENRCIFTHTDGDAASFDYFTNQWSTITNVNALASTVYRGSVCIVREDGSVTLEDRTTYFDNGSFRSMRLMTPWIKTSGLAGFQRIREINLVFDNDDPCLIQCAIAYDFDDSLRESFLFDTAQLTGDVYGTGTYGADEYGTGDRVCQIRMRPEIQKCSAIRLEVRDLRSSGTTTGKGIRLIGGNIVFSTKRGANKVPSNKIIQ